MEVLKQMNTIKKIYERLVDEESKQIFEARLEYIFDRNLLKMKDRLWDLSCYKKFHNKQLECYFATHEKNKVIIFGGGLRGRHCRHLLEKYDIQVTYFCDNDKNKIGTYIDGVLCLSVDEVCQKYRDYTVIPISPVYRKEMFDQLICEFFPLENILYLRGGELALYCQEQYFDFKKINAKKDNIFVDAGSYDGQTTLDFMKWCNNNYKKIYCFEPNRNNYYNVSEKFKDNSKIQVINAGTWNKEGKLSFLCDGAASRITDEDSECSISVKTIDSIVGDENISFIKMDVEGAEIESLRGAKNTIIKNEPDLAICIYHKYLDFIDIPELILNMVPEYKLAIRHYSNNTTETVLYAFIERENDA